MARDIALAERCILAVFSPTRAVIDYLKRGKQGASKRKLITYWNNIFLGGLLVFIAAAYLFHVRPRLNVFTWLLIWIFPVGRVNELWHAFWRDSFDQIMDTSSTETLDSLVHRLRNLIRSYLEVTINFGVLYFYLPSHMFRNPFHGIAEALYFSAVTITTLGYGDNAPSTGFSQFWCVYELGVGFTLIILTFGLYIAKIGSAKDPHRG
jgi:hypothetical protein